MISTVLWVFDFKVFKKCCFFKYRSPVCCMGIGQPTTYHTVLIIFLLLPLILSFEKIYGVQSCWSPVHHSKIKFLIFSPPLASSTVVGWGYEATLDICRVGSGMIKRSGSGTGTNNLGSTTGTYLVTVFCHFPVSSQLLRSSVYLVLKLMLFPVFAATVASVAVLIRIILAKFVSLTENVRQFFFFTKWTYMA